MMIKKVGVVGAGMMGAEIALCFTKTGYPTVLNDIKIEFAENGVKKQEAAMNKSISKGKMTEEEKAKALSLVQPSADYNDLADCDLIIEAALENLDIKLDIFKKLDGICKPETIFCSNTSSISITKLASAVEGERKGKFLGTHFNSPASIMKLVEVIPAMLSEAQYVDEVYDILESIGKVPVRVKDVVGFGLNRIFHCMYAEAMRLIEEGVCTPEDVDKICKYGLGHPMGICALLDTTGHDLNLAVDEIMFAAYGERFRPSPQIQRLVDSGRLGKKTGAGFYEYNK